MEAYNELLSCPCNVLSGLLSIKLHGKQESALCTHNINNAEKINGLETTNRRLLLIMVSFDKMQLTVKEVRLTHSLISNLTSNMFLTMQSLNGLANRAIWFLFICFNTAFNFDHFRSNRAWNISLWYKSTTKCCACLGDISQRANDS